MSYEEIFPRRSRNNYLRETRALTYWTWVSSMKKVVDRPKVDVENLWPTVITPVKGKGTRLYPLTLDRSKSLVPVVNVSILERILGNMAIFGCENFWIVGEYELYNYFRNGDTLYGKFGLNSHVSFNYTTEDDKGNADGVRMALEKRNTTNGEYKINGDVIIVSGDCVIDLDWKKLMEIHRKHDADITIVLKKVEDVSDYGVARLGPEKIEDFIEKPESNNAPSNLANTFINVTSSNTLREVFKEMKAKNLECTDFGKHIIPYMVKNRLAKPYINEGFWNDVGTPRALLETNLAMLQGKVGMIDLEPRIHPTSEHSVGSNVELENVIIGANVSIGSNCKLQNVCVDSNTTIEDDVEIRDSVVHFGARIGRGCRITKSIIDNFGYTGEKTQVGDYDPDETTVVGAYTRLGDGWQMWPGELAVKYSPETREKIVDARRGNTNLYKIVGDDEENLYFVDRTILKKTYGDMPPMIFAKYGSKPG